RFGRVTQVSGVRFEFALARPRGQRVTSITRADGTPLDSTRVYKVACNNFMATGGDNNETLSQGASRLDTGRTVRVAIEALVAKLSQGGGAVDYQLDGRIRRSGGGTGGNN